MVCEGDIVGYYGVCLCACGRIRVYVCVWVGVLVRVHVRGCAREVVDELCIQFGRSGFEGFEAVKQRTSA